MLVSCSKRLWVSIVNLVMWIINIISDVLMMFYGCMLMKYSNGDVHDIDCVAGSHMTLGYDRKSRDFNRGRKSHDIKYYSGTLVHVLEVPLQNVLDCVW